MEVFWLLLEHEICIDVTTNASEHVTSQELKNCIMKFIPQLLKHFGIAYVANKPSWSPGTI